MFRWLWCIFAGLFTLSALVSACSGPTKYRVLSFFLDGVPVVGSGADKAASPTGEPGARLADGKISGPARAPSFPHAPYRDNQCAGCHDSASGQLIRTVEDGLCQVCHQDIPGDVHFVHGPVAVNDCLFCHHYHVAPFPKLLLRETNATCFECHDAADLSPGEHHQDLKQRSCVECHNPHGSNTQFLLKRAER